MTSGVYTIERAMIADARELIFSRPSQLVLPSIVLSVTILSLNLVSDALADRIDPRYSSRRGEIR